MQIKQPKSISVTELQRNFRKTFDRVLKTREACVLTRDDRPEVVMIPYDDWARLAPALDGRARREDLTFDLGDDIEPTDAFLAWRERERARDLGAERGAKTRGA